MSNETLADTRTVKRKAKDSVFTVLFQDINNVYELYKELHPEDTEVTVDDIHIETLEKKATAIPPALDGGSRLPKA